jgi:hypothetical protein
VHGFQELPGRMGGMVSRDLKIDIEISSICTSTNGRSKRFYNVYFIYIYIYVYIYVYIYMYIYIYVICSIYIYMSYVVYIYVGLYVNIHYLCKTLFA